MPAADDAAVARALAVPTRAGIYRRLRTEGQPLAAREVADMFGLHPNVARNHLDQLADVGLVVTGRRKHPGGGRPAKVYVAREQAAPGRELHVPQGSQLAVHTIVQLIAGLSEHRAKLTLLAEEQGRRLVAATGGRADARDFEAAAVIAVEALRAAFPEVRVAEVEGDRVVVQGLEIGLRLIGEVDGQVGDALATGFLRGALAAAGAPATVTAHGGRVEAELDEAGLGAQPSPVATVDARGESYQRGVVAAMRAIVPLRPGDHLEVLTDGQGSPAAYARWADRAGHQLVDVARTRDVKGRAAVRLLLRKATGPLRS
ncbi:helix-turn-helix domain-containing protein [Egicoccus halophilus]|uniref:helix-turn-helix domain-containing protein n=1 Tax=Egicoccus halophilus TaxID=1670830 RepID=UPI0013EEA7A7|nr:helix-turn-helix domain-containing protein [Egicoccus halophilus]